MFGFNKLFFLIVIFCSNTFLVSGAIDSLENQKQIETFNKYLKLSKDEQFELTANEKLFDILEKL